MKNTPLLFALVFAAGFGAGILVWQRVGVKRLAANNEALQSHLNEAIAAVEASATSNDVRIDADELKRLRNGQAELLRLRGQVLGLRRDADAARAQATNALARIANIGPVDAPTNQSPVDAFTANVTATVGWKQMLVTGGWKLRSGKRAFVIVQPHDAGDGQVLVVSRLFDAPEDLLPELGLAEMRASDNAEAGGGILSAGDALGLIKKLQAQEGVDLLNAPRVTTLTGQQAQISVTESHALPSGQSYTTGPTIDIVPTIGADKQTVELVVGVQLNLGRASAP